MHLNLNISHQGKVWEGWLWSDLIQLFTSRFLATGCAQELEPSGAAGAGEAAPSPAHSRELGRIPLKPLCWHPRSARLRARKVSGCLELPRWDFLSDAWARLLDSGENNHTRFPKLPWGSDGKFLLYLPPEMYPPAASSLGSLSRDLYISARDGVATERARYESLHFQEARRMVLPCMKGTGDFFC